MSIVVRTTSKYADGPYSKNYSVILPHRSPDFFDGDATQVTMVLVLLLLVLLLLVLVLVLLLLLLLLLLLAACAAVTNARHRTRWCFRFATAH